MLRNLSTGQYEEYSEDLPEADSEDEPRRFEPAPRAAGIQMDLLAQLKPDLQVRLDEGLPLVFPPAPSIEELKADALSDIVVDDLVVGLGFEERTFESTLRLLSLIKARRVLALRYENDGHADAMCRAVRERGIPLEEISYGSLSDGKSPQLGGRAVVDVTGLVKPALFSFVRAGMRTNEELLIAYTSAAQYYPLETDLKTVLDAYSASDHHLLLTALRDVLTGETGPYQSIPLLAAESDRTRLRALSAFASPRHERLLHITGAREYDAVQVITDVAETSRARVGGIAARVALEDTPGGVVASADAGNLSELVGILLRQHEGWFVRGGLDYEIGLTGNKMQATAAAIASAVRPISQVWYVKPQAFDQPRFTKGVGTSRYFRVSRQNG